MTDLRVKVSFAPLIKYVFVLVLTFAGLVGCGASSGSGDSEVSGKPDSPNINSGNNSGSSPNEGNGSDEGSNSGGDGNSSGGDNVSRPSSQPELKPATSIKLNRNLKVLILSSNTSDRRALNKQEIDASFRVVKEVLAYNQITNNYQLSYAQYSTSMSSRDMIQYYSHNAINSLYPESYALSQSNWIKKQENIALINDADIVVLRTSFNSANTSGAFWGAAAGEAIIWPNLAKIKGLDLKTVFLNSPVDPESNAFPYEHNNYLAEAQKLTKFDRIFAHEFIHALGYGAHDNGVDLYQTEDFSKRVKNDLAFGQTVGNSLSYGDCFSVMGNSTCSLMLSPSAKEFLGVSLDFQSVYKTGKVSLKAGQLLKVFLGESLQAGGHERVLSYITLEPPLTTKYGQTLTGEIELQDATYSLRPNLDGYLVRLVKVNVSIEGTPNVILLDAAPPLNNAAYTLKPGTQIDIGSKVRISYGSRNNGSAEFNITYL